MAEIRTHLQWQLHCLLLGPNHMPYRLSKPVDQDTSTPTVQSPPRAQMKQHVCSYESRPKIPTNDDTNLKKQILIAHQHTHTHMYTTNRKKLTNCSSPFASMHSTYRDLVRAVRELERRGFVHPRKRVRRKAQCPHDGITLEVRGRTRLELRGLEYVDEYVLRVFQPSLQLKGDSR